MPDNMVHVVYSLLTKEVEITTIMCYDIISKASSAFWLFSYSMMITRLLELYGVFEIDQSTICRMLHEGISKRQKIDAPSGVGSSFAAPSPSEHPKVPPFVVLTPSEVDLPPPPPIASVPAPAPPLVHQSEPLVPTYVWESLEGLYKLFGRVIGHLEKIADKLNLIKLYMERLEQVVAPQLPHHPSVPLDLMA